MLFFSLMFVADMTLCVNITIVFIRITEKYQQALCFNAKCFALKLLRTQFQQTIRLIK